LKHRENKNQRQRIICFVGSPVDTTTTTTSSSSTNGKEKIEESLVKLGKKLKKNNVAVDVIVFGDEGMKSEDSLRKFIEAVGSGDNR
jgi:26S proteasome regulatory subunit N10